MTLDSLPADSHLSPDVSREVAAHFAGRPCIPGSIYKLLDNTVGVSCMAEPVCCDSDMSARATICTVGVDRSKEIIVPMGVRTDNYRLNPVVLWNHGFGSIEFPVGTSDNEQRNPLSLEISENRIDATCWFTQKTLEAAQLYELVRDKVVRATSIHVQPLARTKEVIDGIGAVLVTLESDLIEWSWGCMGVNPEAVAKTLGLGRLAGKPITDRLKFALGPYSPAINAWSPGMTFPLAPISDQPPPATPLYPITESLSDRTPVLDPTVETVTKTLPAKGSPMAYSAEQLAAMTDEELKAVGEKSTELDETSQALVKAEIGKRAAKATEKPAEVEAEESETEDSAETEVDSTPLGAQVLTSLHESIKGVVDVSTAALKPVENADVKAATEAILSMLGDLLTEIEGLYSKTYPDQKGLASSGETEVDTSEMVVKSWLRSSQRNELMFSGIGARLASLSAATNLKPAQRQMLATAKSFIDRTLSSAKQSVEDAHEQRLKKLEEGNKLILEKLNRAIPANRR